MQNNIALVGAFWNCADRAERLLTDMRPYFGRIAIAVQESPDDTLKRVKAIADVAIPDRWYGHGNISFQKAIDEAHTPWCLLISDDERPNEKLLDNLEKMVDFCVRGYKEGLWFHFRSTIEGFDFTREQDNHLRLFKIDWGWPPTIHSRPNIPMFKTSFWPDSEGYISHDRSLNEMMLDYLRRYEIGKGDPSWTEHNRRMMRAACTQIAIRRGVEYVKGFEWWPLVEQVAYDEPLEATMKEAAHASA